MVYGSPGEPGLKAAVDAFSQKYGINASYVRLVGGQLSARYLAEKQSGAATADAILINNATFVTDAEKQGLITPLADLKIPGFPWNFPKKFMMPDEGTAVVGLQVRGITYNTNFVKDGEIKDWSDILKPKYKGHLGIPDPASAAVYVGHWYTVGEHYGGAETFLKEVRAQLGPNAVYASGVPASAAVGAGEVWIVPMNIASTTKTVTDQGAPLGFVVPKTTTTDEQVVLVNSKPAHPNAAKLFAAFMMSPDGADTMAKNNNETSPFDTAHLPKTLWEWPLSLADEKKADVVNWLTGK
jgi:iron(III) transport system substrate-binding protein